VGECTDPPAPRAAGNGPETVPFSGREARPAPGLASPTPAAGYPRPPMPSPRFRSLVVGLAAVLLLAGCGESTTSVPARAAIDASPAASASSAGAPWVAGASSSALVAASAPLVAAAASTARARASVPPVEAELVAATMSVAPGGTVRVGLRLAMAPGWHVYWRSPGDSGQAPTITWTLPAGVTASPIAWPVPRRMVTPPLATYVYDDDVLLPVMLSVPPDFAGATLEVVAAADWLVCEDECQPGATTLRLAIPVRADAPAVDWRTHRWFVGADAVVPRALPGGARAAAVGAELVGLVFGGDGPWRDPASGAHLFLDDGDAFARVEEQPWVDAPAGRTLVLPRTRTPGIPAPTRVRGLLVGAHPTQGPFAFEVDVPIEGTLDLGGAAVRRTVSPPTASHAAAAPPTSAGPTSSGVTPGPDVPPSAGAAVPPTRGPASGGGAPPTLAYAVLLAFLGGLLLNVMPCVLPVLSVKALGFVEQVGERPGHVRAHGLVFAAGVIVAFWAIVGVVLALRGAGQAVGWGFQFQNPVFVGVCALLLLGMSLNLVGLFELGTRVAAAAGQAETGLRRGTWTGSFASGLLATVIATPCTAPFMGTAVGFAMTASATGAFAVFTALGLGMALPFVALLWFPALLAKVPRPGPWMETFRQVLSFPMFATTIWLGYVFGRTVGVSGLTWLLSSALALAVGAWAYGRFGGAHVGPRMRGVLGRGLPLAAVVASVVLLVGGARKDPAAEYAPPAGWVAWSPGVVDDLRAQGRAVFLDFTADWCLTCKVNEATILSTDAVEEGFRRHGYVKVVADWTRPSEPIRLALEALGRSSVPTYVVYPADRSRPPEVLPTAITPGIVIDALARGVAPAAPAVAPEGTSR